MSKILIIDDDLLLCKTLERNIRSLKHDIAFAHTVNEGSEKNKSCQYDLILLDVNLPDGNGLDLLPQLREAAVYPEVIIITSAGDQDGAELAITNGAWNYIEKPFSKQDLILEVTRALETRDNRLKSTVQSFLNRQQIIGDSPKLKESLELLSLAASMESTVLITGETGTGKELFARAIHENSQRKNSPLIVVDCAAIPETLIESLLFGSRKGAFTGADKDTEGLIKQADGGTLFLDEVGELPLQFQKVFLRVLQERRFRSVGASSEVQSDFRLVAATNRNLHQMVEQGTFRSDLLFRLQALAVTIPPLRQRIEDIGTLARHYVTRFCENNHIDNKGFSRDFIDALCSYSWPGNIRELINAMEWTVTVAKSSEMLYPTTLPKNIRINLARSSIKKKQYQSEERRKNARCTKPFPKWQDARSTAMQEAEKNYLRELILLAESEKEALQLSGMSRTRLYTLLKEHNLSLRN